LEVEWVTAPELISDSAKVLLIPIDASRTKRWEDLPLQTRLPTVALLLGSLALVEAAEVRLTRSGFHECLAIEGLTATELGRTLRRAVARTQNIAAAPNDGLPHADALVGPCPRCGAPDQAEFESCTACGEEADTGLAATIAAHSMPENRSRLIGAEHSGYMFEELIQVGSFGAVYRATRHADQLVVAVKVLNLFRDETDETDDTRSRFDREGSIQRKLLHPNIVSVLDRTTVDNRPAIVMEFVPGQSLQQFIESGDAAISSRKSVVRFLELLDGVGFAHRWGIVHRDIKPANILVDDSQEPAVWKLTDFGLAKLKGRAGTTRVGEVLGTARYMAPEQISNAGKTDERADVYSLAGCIFELLSGSAPFPHKSDIRAMVAQLRDDPGHVSDLNPGIPRTIGDVVQRGLTKEPENRYRTCSAFGTALRRAMRETWPAS
jgi:tRNA A-37 threonylcarbamoyl transferase component Bud32